MPEISKCASGLFGVFGWFCVVLFERSSSYKQIPQLSRSIWVRKLWAALPHELLQDWSLIWSFTNLESLVWPKYLHSSSLTANKNSTSFEINYANQLTLGKFCRLPVLISLLTTRVTKWQQWMMTWLSIHIQINPSMKEWIFIECWMWMNDSISISKLTSLLF